MSVLVSNIPPSNHSYLINQYFNGKKTMHVNNEHDQVPFGVVSSMKQQLLKKLNKHDIQPNITKQMSRSQDNLLANSHLQFKENRIVIIDRTPSTYRHSYSESIADEVPKPGTVSTVKDMFERQIRLSRCEQPNTRSTRTNSRHSTRARSVSPNDMALRQRRTVAVPTMISIPDVIISHRPTKEIVVIPSDKNQQQQQSVDFRSRLAVFSRTNNIPDVIETNTKSSISSGQKKVSTRVQFIEDIQIYEYPSFRLLMSEYSTSSNSDSEPDNHVDEQDTDDEFERIYAEYKSNEQSLESKGTQKMSFFDFLLVFRKKIFSRSVVNI